LKIPSSFGKSKFAGDATASAKLNGNSDLIKRANDLARCLPQHRFAWIALRELVGQAAVREEPSDALGADGSAVARARADVAAHALALDARARPLFRDPACQELYPHGIALWWTVGLSRFPEDGLLDGHGQRSLALQLSSFAAAGAVAVRTERGHRVLQADAAKFPAAAAELFQGLAAIEAGGDAQPAADLIDGKARRLDAQLRDETAEKLRNVPRSFALLPPVLRPVLADGKVADAEAVPVESVDAEILRSWTNL